MCWPDIPVIGHAAEHDFISILKTAVEGCGSVMPFTDSIGAVSQAAQMLPHQGMLRRNGRPPVLEMKEFHTGMKHGPAGHAYRPAGTTGNMGMGKGCSPGYQSIQVGRADGRTAQGPNGIEAHIIGEQKQNIRFRTHRNPYRYGGVTAPPKSHRSSQF